MAKNVQIAPDVSIRGLTSYKKIFNRFGHIFDRNKTEPRTTQEHPVIYLKRNCSIPINIGSNDIDFIYKHIFDPEYADMKKKNSGCNSIREALVPRAEREIKEMNERHYEDLLIENPDNEQNYW